MYMYFVTITISLSSIDCKTGTRYEVSRRVFPSVTFASVVFVFYRSSDHDNYIVMNASRLTLNYKLAQESEISMQKKYSTA